jgi:hypothetical protein
LADISKFYPSLLYTILCIAKIAAKRNIFFDSNMIIVLLLHIITVKTDFINIIIRNRHHGMGQAQMCAVIKSVSGKNHQSRHRFIHSLPLETTTHNHKDE